MIEQFHSTEDSDNQDNLLSQIQNKLNEFQRGGVRLTSADARAQYASHLAQTEVAIAGFTLVAFIQPETIPLNNHNALKGFVHALMFQHAISKRGIAHRRKALEETKNQWHVFVNDSTNEYEKYRKDYQALLGKISETRNNQESKYDKLVQDSTSKLEALEKTYDEELALRKPVQYWKAKAEEHSGNIRKFTWAFGIASTIAAALLGFEIQLWLIPEFGKTIGGGSNYFPLAIAIVSAAFIFWPLRILSRILLSNIHLKTDAEERVTMANTYLSLLRSEGGLKDGDRRLILETLFRQASTGIVKDDGMPPSMTNAISRFISGDSRR